MDFCIGIDIGSQKTILVDQSADIVLTDTGSVTRPTLISFNGKNRLLGEEAIPQIFSDSTLTSFNHLLAKSLQEIQSSFLFPHRKTKFSKRETAKGEEEEEVQVAVSYCGEKRDFSLTSLIGMYIAALAARCEEVYPSKTLSFAISVPPNASEAYKVHLLDCCAVAGISTSKIFLSSSTDCLVTTYGRKLSGLRPPERALLEGKHILLLDMGHTSTSVVVLQAFEPIKGGDEGKGPIKCGEAFSDALGGHVFDLQMYSHFAKVCETKHATKIEAGTKRSSRLLDACERLRKLLSQLPEASTTVENLVENGDVTFTMKRDELSTIGASLLTSLQSLIHSAFAQAGLTAADVHGIELLGGGVRMQIVQAAIAQMFPPSIVMGAKLDDCSVALGASLRCCQGLAEPSSSIKETGRGLSSETISTYRQQELDMQKTDAEVRALLAARNSLEAYVLDMRGVPRRKHGQNVDVTALNAVLDACEDWIYEHCAPDSDTSTEALLSKGKEVKEAVERICSQYFAEVEKDKVAFEKSLEVEASKAAMEKDMAGAAGDEDDHDTRKLTKADRMRLVVKNKEEGNELFKGTNYRPAAARYHKALSHCSKFYDVSEDDKKEIKALKLSLYLNLASCYLKMELFDQVIRNVDDALEIDPLNPKAFFRRSAAYEGKKDFDKALVDIKKAQELTPTEDKMISKSVERIKKEVLKAKDQEKKTWSKAFNNKK